MKPKQYEFGHIGWRQKLPSIVLKSACACLMAFFAIDCILADDAVNRARSMNIALVVTIFYCNIDYAKTDLKMFFNQPANILGIPLLIITAGLGLFGVYLNSF